jgi:hypothetical protein
MLTDSWWIKHNWQCTTESFEIPDDPNTKCLVTLIHPPFPRNDDEADDKNPVGSGFKLKFKELMPGALVYMQLTPEGHLLVPKYIKMTLSLEGAIRKFLTKCVVESLEQSLSENKWQYNEFEVGSRLDSDTYGNFFSVKWPADPISYDDSLDRYWNDNGMKGGYTTDKEIAKKYLTEWKHPKYKVCCYQIPEDDAPGSDACHAWKAYKFLRQKTWKRLTDHDEKIVAFNCNRQWVQPAATRARKFSILTRGKLNSDLKQSLRWPTTGQFAMRRGYLIELDKSTDYSNRIVHVSRRLAANLPECDSVNCIIVSDKF